MSIDRTHLKKPLRGLFVAQFLGAFNDNALKLFLALLAMRVLRIELGDGAEYESASHSSTTLAFVVFTLPLMLFSLPAAICADRFGKRGILVWTKTGEIGLMGAATIALWLEPNGGPRTLLVLAGMGAQSAFFSPAKYGILPELLPARRLTAGNGRLEMWTFFAIILGTMAGGVLLDVTGDRTWVAGLVLMSLSLIGWLAVKTVPVVPAARADGKARDAIGEAWRAVRADQTLWFAVLGSVMFWGVASLVSQDALVYGKTLGLSDTQAGIPLGVCVLGIGFGAYLVGRLSRRTVETGWIPLGSIGIGIACTVIGAFQPGYSGTLFAMALLGVCSGIVVVPLNTLIQLRSPSANRGGVIALANVFAFGGVLAGTLGCDAMARSGLTSSGIFLGAAAIVFSGTVWAVWLLPDAGLRLVMVLLTRTIYRLTVRGRVHVPAEGPVLLVSNHVSFVDGLLLQACVDRPIRFLVDAHYYRKPLVRPLMKLLGFVPIDRDASPRQMLESIRAAGAKLDEGEIVCIFAEGEITRTGQLLPFRRGFQRILKGRDVPIVPVHLDRVWGSVFSFGGGRPLCRRPARLPYPVTVSFGNRLPSTVPVHAMRNAVAELAASAWEHRRECARPLHDEVVRRVRRRPWRLACADATRPRMSRLGFLVAAIAIARALRRRWRGQERVGIFLPPSVGGAAVNLAASLAGRCVVNLNYTVGRAALDSAVRQAGLRTIVTSSAFLEKAGLELPDGVEVIWLEDLRRGIGPWRRLVAGVLALAAPIRMLERACGAERRTTADDPAAVIFSSGSTGEPKGVVLSHFNIAVNAEGAAQALPLLERDRLLGVLPLFHSFGTLALWLTLRSGLATVYHPNPLDAAAVGDLVERYEVTVMIATPSFLQLYIRRVPPWKLGSLKLVVAGAEKLSIRLADAFEERFGLRPLEGYGATECSPVIAVNSPGYRARGFYQSGSRRGSVGRPLPGIAVRIVSPETGEEVDVGESGVLLVRGPNVMQGYLGRDDLTANVLQDGWYRTGDIARVDEDGFLEITDRLSRFSKIGGEMVPHGVVEAALHEAAKSIEQTFAVTGLPCPRKGERLVVLHTVDPDRIRGLLDALQAAGLPALFVPRLENFVRVDQLPLLGTGKLDLRRVRQVAEDHFAPSTV